MLPSPIQLLVVSAEGTLWFDPVHQNASTKSSVNVVVIVADGWVATAPTVENAGNEALVSYGSDVLTTPLMATAVIVPPS